MSRTYRKRNYEPYTTEYRREMHRDYGRFWFSYEKLPKRLPTKKELAMHHRDKKHEKNLHSYFNVARRKIRAAERRECKKALTWDDFECYDFNTTGADAYLKGIWWVIY